MDSHVIQHSPATAGRWNFNIYKILLKPERMRLRKRSLPSNVVPKTRQLTIDKQTTVSSSTKAATGKREVTVYVIST